MSELFTSLPILNNQKNARDQTDYSYIHNQPTLTISEISVNSIS